MEYRIYEEFFEDVQKKLNRISKKCAKNGNPFMFSIIGTEFKDVVIENEKHTYKFYVIEVEGTAKIDDWECVAVAEIHTTGNVIKNINNDIEIPKRFWTSENVCEHCGTKRTRNNLYIIHNVKTGDFKQVGKNCLMEYTGGLNAEYVVSFIDGITYLEEQDGCVGGGGKIYYDIETVLGYATELINKLGYFNSNDYGVSTKELVGTLLIQSRDLDWKVDDINKTLQRARVKAEVFKSDFDKKETDEKVHNIIEYYMSLDPEKSEFVHNVQLLLADKYITYKNLGYICYLPQGYDKYIQREKEKAERQKVVSAHYGEVKKRYKNVKATYFEYIYGFETQFGYTYVYKIFLETGEILIWKTSKWKDDLIIDDQGENWNDTNGTDDWIIDAITFTVKEHSEYNGFKQTEITRAKTHWKRKEVKEDVIDAKKCQEELAEALECFYSQFED